MTKVKKRIEKAIQNPKNLKFADLDKILKDEGFERRSSRSSGSHFFYRKGKLNIAISYKRPFIKQIYVKQVLKLIGAI